MEKSPILRLGNTILRQACTDVVFPNLELQSIVASMFLVMYKNRGVGLAANQIGISERIAVIDTLHDKEKSIVLINPTIIECSGNEDMIEGCLSLPGFSHNVHRFAHIKIRNHDFDGKEIIAEYEGYTARAVQHEIDHLSGKLFIDRLSAVEMILIENKIKQLTRSYKKEDKGMGI